MYFPIWTTGHQKISIVLPRWNERLGTPQGATPVSSCVARRVCAVWASIKPFVTVPIAREYVGRGDESHG